MAQNNLAIHGLQVAYKLCAGQRITETLSRSYQALTDGQPPTIATLRAWVGETGLDRRFASTAFLRYVKAWVKVLEKVERYKKNPQGNSGLELAQEDAHLANNPPFTIKGEGTKIMEAVAVGMILSLIFLVVSLVVS